MRSKRHHKKQRVYNMRGCSSKSRCGTKKKRVMRGGCGDMCPMTNHSMIGGYVRGPSSKRSNKQRGSKRSDKRSDGNQSDSSNKRSDKQSDERSDKRSDGRSGSTQKGGNVFTDVVRGVSYNGGVLRNAIGGYAPPVSPSPYADQFRSTFSKV